MLSGKGKNEKGKERARREGGNDNRAIKAFFMNTTFESLCSSVVARIMPLIA